MTAAQLRNITVKHDIHPDAPVYVNAEDGALPIPIVDYRVFQLDGRTTLILFCREEPHEPNQELPADDQPGDNARLDPGTL